MANYRVNFFKKPDPKKEDNKDEFLGSVVVDDNGLKDNDSVVGKAFRQCTVNCLNADKTITEKL